MVMNGIFSVLMGYISFQLYIVLLTGQGATNVSYAQDTNTMLGTKMFNGIGV